MSRDCREIEELTKLRVRFAVVKKLVQPIEPVSLPVTPILNLADEYKLSGRKGSRSRAESASG
jgi:hypothetical protein